MQKRHFSRFEHVIFKSQGIEPYHCAKTNATKILYIATLKKILNIVYRKKLKYVEQSIMWYQ